MAVYTLTADDGETVEIERPWAEAPAWGSEWIRPEDSKVFTRRMDDSPETFHVERINIVAPFHANRPGVDDYKGLGVKHFDPQGKPCFTSRAQVREFEARTTYKLNVL